MSNKLLVEGFVIHQRPYQEKRAIYTLFCAEQGVVSAVGSKGLPLFVPIQAFVGGRGSLKTLTQVHLLAYYRPLSMQWQYAALYLNEILYKLLAIDDPYPRLWHSYNQSVQAFGQLSHQTTSFDESAKHSMLFLLRRFESVLFDELGIAFDFVYDSLGELIVANCHYRFVPESGFVPTLPAALPEHERSNCISGGQIQNMAKLVKMFDVDECWAATEQAVWAQADLGRLHRLQIDYLLEYRPLHSRKLWQDYHRLKQA